MVERKVVTLFNLEGARWRAANLTGPELSWLERTTDNREVGGSSPLGPTTKIVERRRGGLAQLEEHLLCKQGVNGSNPLISTKWANSSAG